jgi:hypothetical protein
MTPQPTPISGVVHDAQGNPIPDARVYFMAGPEPLPEIAALTDVAGRFVLTAPRDGDYTLGIAADGFSNTSVDVSVSAGQAPHLDITLSP